MYAANALQDNHNRAQSVRHLLFFEYVESSSRSPPLRYQDKGELFRKSVKSDPGFFGLG